MANLNVGDVVRIKSGGPNMTIELLGTGSNSNECKCQWFVGSKLQDGWFDINTLVIVDEEEEGNGE